MLLTYSKDSFVDDIKNGVKIHSIRLDPQNRWKAGMIIHQWRGNPRNVKAKPYFFKLDVCKSVQKIEILRIFDFIEIYIDGKMLFPSDAHKLIYNDGFKTMGEFMEFFTPTLTGRWVGNLINWTDKKY